MRSPLQSHHFTDADGNPSGGTTYGNGFAIGWQNGPLGRPIPQGVQAKIDACPEPGWQETHRYCPCCPWMENLGRIPANGAFVEDVIAAAADRLGFYQGSNFHCDANARALECLTEALGHLERRTADREARAVEGTHEV